MTTNNDKTGMCWDQSGFEALKSTWSTARIKDDKQLLKNIFNQACFSPVLERALEWAEWHGVQFFVDRQAVNIGGYYTPGTGIVALAESVTNSTRSAVKAITHEIRHAWQDYHGLCTTDFPGPATTPDFAGYFIQLSLIEADAAAFGERAGDEYEIAEICLPDENADLRRKFLKWFFRENTINFYGDDASKHYGLAAGIFKGDLPARNYEFVSKVSPLGSGVDITDTQRILALGKTFSGKNYLAQLPREFLLKKILCPSLAMSFYKAANDDQKKLVADIRKCGLRSKLQEPGR